MKQNLKIKYVGDNILRDVAAPVTDKIAPEIICAMSDILDDLSGVGLAAPQVGIPARFFVMKMIETRGTDAPVSVIVNPEIISMSDKTCVLDEGCLSVQGPDGNIFADVTRPETIVAAWTDENGKKHKRELTGFCARIFQHEYDHLIGKLFIDYLSPTK
ncbi:MAG: peptide deformylase, partial [Rickettsiales bacterium]|nr:peptide deformylase [Rickettsiales bacterium]